MTKPTPAQEARADMILRNRELHRRDSKSATTKREAAPPAAPQPPTETRVDARTERARMVHRLRQKHLPPEQRTELPESRADAEREARHDARPPEPSRESLDEFLRRRGISRRDAAAEPTREHEVRRFDVGGRLLLDACDDEPQPAPAKTAPKGSAKAAREALIRRTHTRRGS